jgi:hypothetical protein
VLFAENEEDPLGIDPKPLVMPRLLPIRDKEGNLIGAIFVLLDNILVLTVEAELTKRWADRITRNSERVLNLQIKREEVHFSSIPLAATSEVTGTPPWEATFSFSGVEFGQEGWRSTSAERPIDSHPATRRGAMILSGALLWEVRVRGIPFRRCKALRHVFQACSAGEVANDQSFWDGAFAIPEWCRGELNDLIQLREARSYTPCRRPWEAPPKVVELITDATPTAIAWVVTSPFTDVYARECEERDVAWTETKAIVEAVTEFAPSLEEGSEIRILSDNTIACAIFEKGYSRSPELDELVDEAMSVLDKHNIRLRIAWIPSADNVADTPSRRVSNRRCERCQGWRRPDYDGDVKCICERPLWAENLGELQEQRLASSLRLMGHSFV